MCETFLQRIAYPKKVDKYQLKKDFKNKSFPEIRGSYIQHMELRAFYDFFNTLFAYKPVPEDGPLFLEIYDRALNCFGCLTTIPYQCQISENYLSKNDFQTPEMQQF